MPARYTLNSSWKQFGWSTPVRGLRGWAPATDGLRNLTGCVDGDGTATNWAITSTVSGNGDLGPTRIKS